MAMATAYARWILSTHSRSTLKKKGFEPSTDLEFENDFFNKVPKLKTFFFLSFSALIEVVTGHCKNAVNRAGGHLGAPL